MRIFSGLVPICAATSFLRSPMVSSSLFVRVGGGRRGVGYGQVRALGSLRVPAGCPPWGKRWGGWAFCGVGCVDTHLHLTRIFLPRRSLSTTSIMRAVAYPSDDAYAAWKCAPRMATSTFCHQFSRNFDGADRQTKFSTARSATSSARDHPIMRTRSALLLIAIILGCLLGARAQATVSFSPTSAFPNRYARVHPPASSP